MARNKKNIFTFVLWAEFVCPNTGKVGEINFDEHDLAAGEQECEMCGSYGWVTLDFKCSICGKEHEIDIKSW